MVECNHKNFGVIKEMFKGTNMKGTWMYELRCYDCDEALPFFFYTRKEWRERKGDA